MVHSSEPSIAAKFDLLACIQCGRCTAGCPVALKSSLNIRRLVREASFDERLETVLKQKDLWDCTTCSTCTIRCPRGIKPHELVIGIRAALIEGGRVPVTARDALESVFKHGNPWGRVRTKRSEWAAGLGVKDLSQGDKAGLLCFVGCTAAYDPRVQDVARALAKCLSKAGVDFGILGNEESCCGNEVRRLGEEGLFETLVEDNLELFRRYDVSRMVTICPHGYNVFKNEYKDANLEVKHYTQYVAQLIDQGKVVFSGEVKKVVTYHDPCFLGKQNKVFDEPRRVIKAIPGVTFVELDRSREKSLCCEGGGGRMWVEASGSGQRLGEMRIAQAIQAGAEMIATACPFCLRNLEDAVKTTGNEAKIQVKDIMELVSMAI